jgi:hypothetical protein
MATFAQPIRASRLSRLKPLPGRGGSRTARPVSPEQAAGQRPAPLRLVRGQVADSILIAGRDARRRDKLRRELSARLPAGTRFQEAAATWEVLEHAPASRMVMLAGELDGGSAESVAHLLGNRHPQLPVLALGASGAA